MCRSCWHSLQHYHIFLKVQTWDLGLLLQCELLLDGVQWCCLSLLLPYAYDPHVSTLENCRSITEQSFYCPKQGQPPRSIHADSTYELFRCSQGASCSPLQVLRGGGAHQVSANRPSLSPRHQAWRAASWSNCQTRLDMDTLLLHTHI